MIRGENLVLAYGKKTVLENGTFHIEPGQAAVLLGDNGSGKSTLLSAIAGALKPKAGTIQVNGRVGYIPQGSGLMEELTFQDNLRFFAALAGVKVPQTLPLNADKLRGTKVREMSGGMKKLCSIMCAVIANPDVLILDEPCASLDAEHKQMLIDYLCSVKAAGMTLIYVGHNRKEHERFADRYFYVDHTVRELTGAEYKEMAGELV